MHTSSQVASPAWFKPSKWLDRSNKNVLTSLIGVGILRVRVANKWRTSKQSINLEKLKNVALKVRSANYSEALPRHDYIHLTYEVEDAYLGGSYNFFFNINFSDGNTWLARIADYSGCWDDQEIQKHSQDQQTLDLLRRTTTLPIPEVFFGEPSTESMGRSFALLSYLPGERLFEKWFDDIWATEGKRLRTLTQIAESMAELGKLRFKEVGGLLFDPSRDSVRIGPTYEHRKMHAESSEVVSYGPWRTYQHYQRDREGQMSHEINAPGKLHRKLILMASRSIPDVMYGDGTYLAHPDFNLQNILVDDEGNVSGIIDWDDTWARSRSTGYASFPMWLTQDWDPAKYAWNDRSDPGLDDLCRLQSRPDELRRWRKHYSAVFLNKWAEHLEAGMCDIREHTHSHIMQAIDYALLCKASCPAIVVKLLDHAFRGDMFFDLEKFTGNGYDQPEEADVLAKIGQAFDEMWLCEPEF